MDLENAVASGRNKGIRANNGTQANSILKAKKTYKKLYFIHLLCDVCTSLASLTRTFERGGWFVHHITQGVGHHYCSEEDERCPFDKPCCICNWEGWEKKGKNPKEKIKSTKETVLCLVCMQENDSDMKGEAWVYLKCIPKSIVFMKKQCNSFCPISPLVVIRLNLLKNNWWICIYLTLIIIIKTCFWLDLEALVCLFV